jgi:hypothetical protein
MSVIPIEFKSGVRPDIPNEEYFILLAELIGNEECGPNELRPGVPKPTGGPMSLLSFEAAKALALIFFLYDLPLGGIPLTIESLPEVFNE